MAADGMSMWSAAKSLMDPDHQYSLRPWNGDQKQSLGSRIAGLFNDRRSAKQFSSTMQSNAQEASQNAGT